MPPASMVWEAISIKLSVISLIAITDWLGNLQFVWRSCRTGLQDSRSILQQCGPLRLERGSVDSVVVLADFGNVAASRLNTGDQHRFEAEPYVV
jgi:hypothetical protein